MNNLLPPPQEGRWRALIWLAFGDALLLFSGVLLVLSPLLLVFSLSSPLLLALLALPSLSWFFYGLMVLRARAVPLPPPVSNGILLDPGKVPALAADIERLRLACEAPAFTAIYVNDDLNASIYQTAARSGPSKHILVLGLPLLALLTRDQAAVVIAHEYAHISRQHGHFARWAYMARQRWAALADLHERNHRLITAPLRLFLSWYVPRMMRETLEFSRRCEMFADAQAVQVCGADLALEAEFALALRQKAMSDRFWPGLFARAGVDEPAQVQPFTQLLAEPAESRPHDGAQAAAWLHEALCQGPDPRSTHPAFFERVASTGFDPTDPLPGHLPWRLEKTAAATDWLGNEASGIAAQLDANWCENVAQAWRDAESWHARQHEEFAKLLHRRKQQTFDEGDWLLLAQLAEKFDPAGPLRREAIAQGLRHSPDDPTLLQFEAEDLEQNGDFGAAIALWHRIGQNSSTSVYDVHRRLCELCLRTGDRVTAEHHRHVADKLWTGQDAGQFVLNEHFPHGMDASEVALLQGVLQPLFAHARSVWLCRDKPADRPDAPGWFLYVEAYDDWFMRMVGRLTGEEDVNASACKRLLERLLPRLHIYADVVFIGPSENISACCSPDSLIAHAGRAVSPPLTNLEKSQTMHLSQ
ncbi:M48 family metalloprotease [Rhizobium sp. P40RR-XXII]|uniref:M48 family metallopeptidase n=1 Tax=unclassified Rhizobium TaxID=2613769 RepID=UPI0014570F20|nr:MULTISPECIES: M48 family metallopeptidase [unclassified Rhizobium]NLR84654.1 M48 family metalloprotease [Rhizobium sp. P28RR-XV]NLS16439.1 M48 family metalloprotease [Rhizobium sp. P40RR-XXII]